jgi:hypothetical protein
VCGDVRREVIRREPTVVPESVGHHHALGQRQPTSTVERRANRRGDERSVHLDEVLEVNRDLTQDAARTLAKTMARQAANPHPIRQRVHHVDAVNPRRCQAADERTLSEQEADCYEPQFAAVRNIAMYPHPVQHLAPLFAAKR